MSDDEIVELAAQILDERGYEDAAQLARWAIGRADYPTRLT